MEAPSTSSTPAPAVAPRLGYLLLSPSLLTPHPSCWAPGQIHSPSRHLCTVKDNPSMVGLSLFLLEVAGNVT